MAVKIDLPDLEELRVVIEEINTLSYEYGKLKLKLEMAEALTVLNASKMKGDDGKLLSTSFINSTYAKTGVNNELIPYRNDLVELSAKLENTKKRYDYLKLLIDIWRTQSANERTI